MLHSYRVESKSNFHFAIVNAAFEFAKTTDTTNEVDTFIRTEVFDTEYFVEDEVRRDSYVENTDWVFVVVSTFFSCERIPFATKVKAEVVKFSRSVDVSTFFFNDEVFGNSSEELFFSEAVQIFHYAVVVDDVELVVREANSEEVVIFFVATVVRVVAAFFVTYECSSSRTVVTVSDIECWEFGKEFSDASDSSVIVDYPEVVSETVRSNEIVFRSISYSFSNDSVNFVDVRISEEYRFNVSIVDADVFHAVFFFIATSKLVFFDFASHIVVNVSTYAKTILSFAIHCLSVNIVALFFVLNEPSAILPELEVFGSFVVHFRFVFISTNWEVDFRFDDVVK